jgi:hypothetical protein
MQILKKVRGRVKLLLSAVVLDAAVGSLTLWHGYLQRSRGCESFLVLWRPWKDLFGYSSWNKKPMGAGLAGDRAVDAGMD